jgi:hypothetical protein
MAFYAYFSKKMLGLTYFYCRKYQMAKFYDDF